jgi:hypothetical protein
MTAFLAVVVSGASVLIVSVFSWWQVRIAREKLRHDLYDRRFALYMAFHELLVAFTEKDDVDAELRRANAARAHSPFLLNAKLENYLKGLHAAAFQLNGLNELALKGLLGRAETADLVLKLGPQKLDFADRIPELVREFEPFLKLRDFSKAL